MRYSLEYGNEGINMESEHGSLDQTPNAKLNYSSFHRS